jgi:hypothetical protein
MNTLLLGKAFHPIVLLLPDTLHEIRANVHEGCTTSLTMKLVTPAQAGVQLCATLDSGLRRNDGSLRCVHTLALQGEGWGGDGERDAAASAPIPLLASPLKGEELALWVVG